MNAKRILNVLGGRLQDRMAPFIHIHPRSTLAWRARQRIPDAHREAVVQALEAHAEEVLEALAEIRRREEEGP